MHSERRLTLKELQHALAVRDNMKELNEDFIPQPGIILSLSAGLVVLDEQSSIVRLVHYTTQEYFERHQEQWFENAETEITITCVAYLLLNRWDLDGSKGNSILAEEYVHSSELQPNSDDSFWHYAVRYWGYHAQRATAQANNSLLCLLESNAHVNACSPVLDYPREYPYGWPLYIKTTGLHLAAYFGLYSPAAHLLDNGFEADQYDEYGYTPLLYAVRRDRKTLVELLLARDDVNPNSPGKRDPHLTSLMFACTYGYVDIVESLLQHPSIAINDSDRSGITPLMLAVKRGHKSIAASLLAKGAEMELKDTSGETALFYAVKYWGTSMIELLLHHGANANVFSHGKGHTALVYAIIHKYEEISRLLIDIGNIEFIPIGNYDDSPLAWAYETGKQGIIDLLLERGPYLESGYEYENGLCLMHHAARRGHVGLVKLLVQRGFDPGPISWNGSTPFLFAAKEGKVVVAKLLLATDKVNPDSKYAGGRTALSYASERGHEDIVKLLLSIDEVDPVSQDADGRTPFSYAAEEGGEGVVNFLLSTDAINPDFKDPGGRTPLFFAAGEGHEGVVKLLLGCCKVDPNSKANENEFAGMTPLGFATYWRKEAVIKTLLNDTRVDPNSKSYQPAFGGRTPLSIAVSYGEESVVRLFLDMATVDVNSLCDNGRTPLDYTGEERLIRLLRKGGAKSGKELQHS